MSKKLTHEEFIEKVCKVNLYVANGDIEIRGMYDGGNKRIECFCRIHRRIWHPYVNSLYKGCGCEECGNEKTKSKIAVSYDDFKCRMNQLNNGISIAGNYINMTTLADFRCQLNHVWAALPYNILSGEGCPYCANRRVLVGYNDLWTVRPDIAQMLKNKEDGYKYTQNSNQCIDFVCPNCGNNVNKQIYLVSHFGIRCQMCSDGVSYPNKFIRQVLKQLKIHFIPEYTPEWGQSKKYDCYFEYDDKKYIIEMDGGFHYVERTISKKSLAERKSEDKLKTQLASEHGIKVIRIECLESECNYIKNNILASSLNDIFDLSQVDWELCDSNAQNSLIKEACKLYMSRTHDLKEIANELFLHKSTVCRYLKTGTKFGWCDYDPIVSKKDYLTSASMPVALIDKNDMVDTTFSSIMECSRKMSDICDTIIYPKGIINSCKTHKPYKGFNFRYAKDTQQND